MLTLDDIVEYGVYFLFGENASASLSIPIAEGLRQLGIPVFANQTLGWRSPLDGEALFECDESISHRDCPVCIADLQGVGRTGQHPLLNNIDRFGGDTIFVALHSEESVIFPLKAIDPKTWKNFLDRFSFVLRFHLTDAIDYPQNYYPWSFGIPETTRILAQSDRDFDDRQNTIFAAFPSAMLQNLPLAMSLMFLPHLRGKISLELQWHPDFFRTPTALKTWQDRQFCCAYQGEFVYGDLATLTPAQVESGDRLPPNPCITRWDSVRFWDSLVAGCVTLHLDFEKYGFRLPVMPENWTHYIGIDLENPKATADRLLNEPELMAKIARQGQQWALDNYSSIPTTCRFLDLVLGEEPGTMQGLVELF